MVPHPKTSKTWLSGQEPSSRVNVPGRMVARASRPLIQVQRHKHRGEPGAPTLKGSAGLGEGVYFAAPTVSGKVLVVPSTLVLIV